MRALVGERYATRGKKVAACTAIGEEHKVKRYKGKALPMVMETSGRLGPETENLLKALGRAAAREALEVSGVPVRVHPDSLFFVRERCACDVGSLCSDLSC